ncbi:MAG: divalent-cation tolerance protein CutA [Akkermansiaceae bacterium]|nr:divalent-cation tolerance protein CutA [Akkermansiaceae bacterium]
MVQSEVLMVFCTFPDLPKARQIGTALVEKQLAACVNLVPGVESIFRWAGEVSTEAEVLAIFKTSAGRWVELERELVALHPYDVPEVVAFPVGRGSEAYLEWVRSETG